MSRPTEEDWLDFLKDTEQVEAFVQGHYTTLASICLFCYDYLLTFNDEVRLIKRARVSLATFLYLVIRYGFLYLITVGIVLDLPVSVTFQRTLTDESCTGLLRATVIINIFVFIGVSAFVALRIMALWSRNWWLGIFLFLLGLTNPTLLEASLLYGFIANAAPYPVSGCMLSLPDNSVLGALEVTYTYGTYKSGRSTGINTPLSTLLLRDGSLYFVVFTALAVLDIAAGLARDSQLPDGIISTFSRSLIPILLTRFIARIRQVRDHGDSVLDSAAIPMTTMNDARHNHSRFLSSVSGALNWDTPDEWLDADADGQAVSGVEDNVEGDMSSTHAPTSDPENAL
ncbi:hypothetical protein C8Q76DRAFT_860290 [Earliella scabrosa]|nr:hypothetical protein C8Q76DRAFT_860290 [Earliella scabrosa]